MSRFRHAREAQARLLAWVEHFNNALNRSFHVELSSDLARLGYWLGEIRAYQRTLKEGRFDLEGLKSISWSVDYNLRQMFCTPVQIQRRSAPPETPSEALFERLAAENPQRLLAMLVANELRPALLTYAAEIAGRTFCSGTGFRDAVAAERASVRNTHKPRPCHRCKGEGVLHG